MATEDEAARLEALWSGEFGDEYAERNIAAGEGRGPFWSDVFERLEARSALEVGCNVGANLGWIVEAIGADNTYGVDVNDKALAIAAERVPGTHVQRAVARELPFADGQFDLTFTTGVLIHQPPDELDAVMREIVRCSGRYVLCGEYYSPEQEEVPYRGHRGALFKLDFGARYQELFPELELIDERFLARGEDSTWDDLTVWTFEKK
jgi:pseudaminic acid biosynthesis-associated methylase